MIHLQTTISKPASRTAASVLDPRIVLRDGIEILFCAHGLVSAEAIMALPGEIVSGHPDRHVMRVVLPDGRCAFLKREHRIRWRDRLRNWRSGHGWTSKSIREGRFLQQLEALDFPCTKWLAFGEDGTGRAFLLIEELMGASDLRLTLPTLTEPRELAVRLGRGCAELHEAGIDHPDMYAKHLFVNNSSAAFTWIDWQRANMGSPPAWPQRYRALAALLATLPEDVGRTLRPRFLWAYRRAVRDHRHGSMPWFARMVRAIQGEARRLERRRGIREQRQPPLDHDAQRLVWLDGEGLCALPEVAADLDPPDVRQLLYDPARDGSRLLLSANRAALLRVGIHWRPLGRFWSWLRGKAWRSPELRLARLLFHLERHRVAATKLLAFGQRGRRDGRHEAFVLTECRDAETIPFEEALCRADEDSKHLLLQRLDETLERLHDAGCTAHSIDILAVRDADHAPLVVVAEPGRLRFRKQLSQRARLADRVAVQRSMKDDCGPLKGEQ